MFVDCFDIGHTLSNHHSGSPLHVLMFVYVRIYDLPVCYFVGCMFGRPDKFKYGTRLQGTKGRKDAQWNLRQETQSLSLTQRLAPGPVCFRDKQPGAHCHIARTTEAEAD